MSELTYTVENRVATVTINRPAQRNAMNREMWLRLPSLLQDCWDNSEVGCVVLTGTGQAFCAGGDVKEMTERLAAGNDRTIDQDAEFVRKIMESARLLHEMSKPTLAVINGACAGAGMALALACDLRIANAEAKFTTAFAGVGGSGDFGGSWFLSNIVGTAKARELYYFANVFDGTEAESIGVVNRAVPATDLPAEASKWASKLANGPSVALSFMKRNMNLAEHGTLAQALDQEALYMTLAMRTDDHREAATAFIEKRKPNFKGR